MIEGNKNGNGIVLRVWACILALAFLPLTAGAVQWNSSTDFVWNAQTGKIDVFPGPGSGNMWAAGTRAPGPTGPTYTSPPKALPFNPSPTFKFKSTFTPSAMAAAMVKGAAIQFLVGSAFEELMKQACVRIAGGQMTMADNSLWEECKFTTTPTLMHKIGPPFTTSAFTNDWTLDKAARCEQIRAAVSPGMGSAGPATKHLDAAGLNNFVQGGSCTIRNKFGEFFQGWSFISQIEQIQVRDGWKDASKEAADARLEEVLGAWTQRDFLYGRDPNNRDTIGIMDGLMAGGREVESTTSSVDSSSQTNINSPPKVETKTVGGVTTTTTTNTTNNYGSTFNPTNNTITITHNVTTTVTNNNTGETTTTTEEQQPEDPCVKNPDRAGCKMLGTPEQLEIPKDTKTLTYTAEDLGLGGGSCPSPVAFSTRAGNHVISYGPACNFVETYMKPVALLIGALMALFILMPGRTDA